MFGWTKETLKSDILDFATMDYKPFEPKTTEELLAFFDNHIAKARAILAETSDETFMTDWTMRNGGSGLFHDAKGRRHAIIRNEPHHPPPRPAFGLPAAQRHPRAVHLWSVGRRRNNVNSRSVDQKAGRMARFFAFGSKNEKIQPLDNDQRVDLKSFSR